MVLAAAPEGPGAQAPTNGGPRRAKSGPQAARSGQLKPPNQVGAMPALPAASVSGGFHSCVAGCPSFIAMMPETARAHSHTFDDGSVNPIVLARANLRARPRCRSDRRTKGRDCAPAMRWRPQTTGAIRQLARARSGLDRK